MLLLDNRRDPALNEDNEDGQIRINIKTSVTPQIRLAITLPQRAKQNVSEWDSNLSVTCGRGKNEIRGYLKASIETFGGQNRSFGIPTGDSGNKLYFLGPKKDRFWKKVWIRIEYPVIA